MHSCLSKSLTSAVASRSTVCRRGQALRSPISHNVKFRSNKIYLGEKKRHGRQQATAMSGGPGMSPELKLSIDNFIASNKVVVFMKGEKESPQCGFSARVVQILKAFDSDFATVNILADERLRSGMKEYSQWPTFPQVYINGEFYGGADIVMEAAQNGQLKEALEVAALE
ncbi:hypothetical protein CEUSTIGMA_g2788.t1 [Chlamydomonas eustigma]|uniref:Glutaredoxin domain-containing protein n=1 Tax=Chlamydomonas eustigma TaxID=1157962 RepID=A0A250WWX0_9CHLO|nr:hypothetical protein CEUSTIGMA_g2788.t1 [Chlamydomonas eustigma]|eukprot:GAX75343.1 hypothetical protein CEUSTIGMA_g2788.t1 [Chlamydomonas eustigma]